MRDDFFDAFVAAKLAGPLTKPDWRGWAGRRRAPIWQAVALSMDADPTYRITRSFLVGELHTADMLVTRTSPAALRPQGRAMADDLEFSRRDSLDCWGDYRRRLAVAKDALLPPNSSDDSEVAFSDLLALAGVVKWVVPDGFQELGSSLGLGASEGAGDSVARCGHVPTAEGAEELPAERRKRLRDRHEYWKQQGVKNPTERVAKEEGVAASRIRQILRAPSNPAPSDGKEQQSKAKAPAAWCDPAMPPSGRPR